MLFSFVIISNLTSLSSSSTFLVRHFPCFFPSKFQFGMGFSCLFWIERLTICILILRLNFILLGPDEVDIILIMTNIHDKYFYEYIKDRLSLKYKNEHSFLKNISYNLKQFHWESILYYNFIIVIRKLWFTKTIMIIYIFFNFNKFLRKE